MTTVTTVHAAQPNSQPNSGAQLPSLLMVAQDFPPELGGIQTYAWELARRFARSCRRFAVVAPHVAGDTAFDATCSFRIFRVGRGSDRFPWTAMWAVPRLALAHGFTTTFHAQWQSAIGAWRARLERYYLAAHGRELLLRPFARVPPAQAAYDTLRSRILTGAARLFPVSRYTAGLLGEIGVNPAQIEVVSNGTDPDHFQPTDASELRRALALDREPVLLTVGRLVRRKGIDTVLAALPAVLALVPDLQYLIVGAGEDRSRLEQLVQTLSLGKHVRFVGAVPFSDLPRYFGLCDVFVTPSRSEPPSVEGFGLVFLEANACGKPVIGTRSGGIPDAIVDGQTGLLVEPDRPAELADAMLALLTDPQRARRLGECGRARAATGYTWEVTHARILAAMVRDASP
ncbi:MAG: glycosyltransferase family 4 protein [Nannocystaceae bacterium]